MNNLKFLFGDGTSAKFDFSDVTKVDALADCIGQIVTARISARSLAGLTRKRDAWSGRRFHVSLSLEGKDCTGHLKNLEFSASKTDYSALAAWAINNGKALAGQPATLEMSTLEAVLN